MRHAKLLIVFGLMALAMVALLWAHEGHKSIKTKGIRIDDQGLLHLEPASRKAIGLALVSVHRGTVEKTLKLNAHVVLPWDRAAYASSRVEGVVQRVLVRPGEMVKAGEPLAMIKSLPLEALRLQFVQSKIEYKLAQQNYERARELGETIVAGREILALEAEQEIHRNSVETLRSKLDAIGDRGAQEFPISSPIDGTVVHIDVMLGQHVVPSEHLFKLEDIRTVWAKCEVPEGLIGQASLGQVARLTFLGYPGRLFSGTIDFAAFSLDAIQSVRHVMVSLDNADGLLLPGMFGMANIVAGHAQDVVVAPANAIVTDGGERYVFVEKEQGIYDKQDVVLGLGDGKQVEVTDGLKPGDVVVTVGNHELSALFVRGTLRLSEAAKKNIQLDTEEIDLRNVERIFDVNARVVSPPDRHGTAVSRLRGKVGKILVVLGEQVKAGQPLAEVESLELVNAQLDLIHAQLQSKLNEKQLSFVKVLADQGIAPRKQLLRLESKVLEANARVAALRRSLLLMGMTDKEIAGVVSGAKPRSGLTLRAPLDGRIMDIHVIVGQIVNPGDELFNVADLRTLWVKGDFFESDLAQLFDGPFGKPAVTRTVAYGTREWKASISFVNRNLNVRENVLEGWVALGNPDNALLPGMHAKLSVSVAMPPAKVLAVPIRAILAVGRKRFLFVKQGDEFKRVETQLGRRDAHYVEVVDGLFPGDQVVVAGVNELNNAFSAVR